MTLVQVTLDVAQPDGRKLRTEFYPVERFTEKGLFVTRPVWSRRNGRFSRKTVYVPKKRIGKVLTGPQGGSKWARYMIWISEDDDIKRISRSTGMGCAVHTIADVLGQEMQNVAIELSRIVDGEG